MDKQYYTCAEVAQIYGVKVDTIWAWVRNGKLGSVRIGQRYRIRKQDLDSFAVVNDNKTINRNIF
nr:MAG TPA: helix-turn-helix domain protein [Caudoviricetes sp.]